MARRETEHAGHAPGCGQVLEFSNWRQTPVHISISFVVPAQAGMTDSAECVPTQVPHPPWRRRATQKGPGIAARPRVAGLLPWIRTDRRHGFGGIRSSRRQGHANLGSVVEAGRCPLTPKGSCGYQPRRPASSRRPGAGNRKPCWMLLSARSLQILPHRLRGASGWPVSRRAVPSLPKPGACAPAPANQGSVPFRFVLPLPAALAQRLPLPFEPCSGVPRNLGSAWAALRLRNFRGLASPNRNRMRFPEGTCTVSGPCKLLILLWFPAAGPFRLQL
jgi:hypothetical protein